MGIQEVHRVINFILNKEQNAYLSHEEIDLVLERAQMAQFNELYNNPKSYRPDAQVPIISYGENQRINDALSPFKASFSFVTTDTPGGVVTLPSDYMYLLSLYTSMYVSQIGRNVTNPVTVLNEEELVLRLESQVIPVTTDDPICIMNSNNKIQLFPDVPQSGKVFYFRKPKAPKFNYTQSGRAITFNPTGSQDLEWRDSDVNMIIVKALSYYGLNISDPNTIQFAETKNVQGQ